MPSKLRKALGAVKDQTSISLAKVTNAANLEVIILKATTHDPTPMENRYVNEIVQLVSSNKVYAAACAQAIGKRIGKTRNWVVALKSLMLVLRIFQDGDPYFPREVFHAMKRGAKILNLSSFRDDSNSSPWDYTAFVRTFALYLDERLDCFLTGKLQRQFNYQNQIHDKNYKYRLSHEPGIKDMKPTMLLDRISYWQRLLDRAIGTRPTGSARTNRLVQISLYAIVRESFDLCKDISDGLLVILDSFFELPYQACVCAFQACVKSSKQFDELSDFYALCTSIGIGRTSEYPSIQKVSDEVIETLQDFLRDQVSNTAQSSLSKHLFLPTPKDIGSSSGQDEASERYETPERSFENVSEYGSQCTSLEDLMGATDAGFSPRTSLEQDMDSDQSDQDDKQSQNDDFSSAYDDSGSVHSLPATTWSTLDLVSLDDFQKEDRQENQIKDKDQQDYSSLVSDNDCKDCWELVLAETATKSNHKASPKSVNRFDPFSFDTFFDQFSVPQHHYNPFLEDAATVAPSNTTVENQFDIMDFFDTGTTFQAVAPTFCAQNSDDAIAPTFRAQNSDDTAIAPTFNIAQTSNFETDLALSFGNLSPNDMAMAPTFRAQDSTETNIAPSFKAQKEFNMALTFSSHDSTNTNMAWGFQSQNPDAMPSFEAQKMFNMTPTFSAQDSTNTSTTQGFQSQNPDTAPSFKVQKECNMAPTFYAQDPTNTIMARGFQSQNLDTAPSFKAQKEFNMASTFNALLDSTNTSTARGFQSQNPNSAPSFKAQIEFNMAPIFNAQDSANHNMAQGFQSQNLGTSPSFKAQDEFNMATMFSAQDSTNSNMARGFQCQNPDLAPTFRAQKEFNMAPTFSAQDSTSSNKTQDFQSQNSDTASSFKAQKEFNMTLTFSPQDLTNINMAQGFQSQNLDTLSSFKAQKEFNMAPTFSAQNSASTNMASFQSPNPDTSMFYAQSSFENDSAPTFYGQRLDERSTTLTFSSQNFNGAKKDPSFATQNHKNPNLEVGPSFQVQNFNPTMKAPTFSGKDFNEMTRATSVQDDPFEPWSSGMTNEYTSTHSMQEPNLLQQQQMWMEQQNKIIAKYMS